MNANEQFSAQIEIIRVYEEDAYNACVKLSEHTEGELRDVILDIAKDEQKHVAICDELIALLTTDTEKIE